MYLAIKLAKQQLALIVVAAFAVSLAVAPVVFAAPAGANCNVAADCDGKLICNAAGKCAAAVGNGAGGANDVFGVNPIKDNTSLGQKDIRVTITEIINVGLGLLGIVAVVIVLAGGFQWMTAGGNEEKIGGAKKLIISGVIGLAIIMSAFAITQFVINELGTATDVKNFQRIQ